MDAPSAKERMLRHLKDLEARLQASERARDEPIAVIGAGCRFPGGADDPKSFWQLLRDGVDAVSEVPRDRWDIDSFYDPDPDAKGKMYTRYGAFLRYVDRFDASFFGISPREAATMDPQQRLLLEVACEALERAGQPAEKLAGSATGVFVGISSHNYSELQIQNLDATQIDAYFGTGTSASVAAGRLSYLLGLQGPSLAIDTACSSSLVAVHLACQSLSLNECSLALAGGVNLILSPMATIIFCKARMMAADGRCKTFDAEADGYVRGEGCGVVVLKRLSKALEDGDPILAVIRGSAVNQDGRSNGLTAPNGPAQEAVIRKALARAGVRPGEIGYVETHGTGTPLGDPIEVRALGAVLREGRVGERVPIGSVKTNMGHLEAAAGVASLIKTVLALQHREVPPHLHLKQINPHIALDQVPIKIPTESMPWPANGGRRIAGVSAFSFSGTNAHVVVESAPEHPLPARAGGQRRPHLLVISGRTPEARRDLARSYHSFISSEEARDYSLEEICYTASARRSHHEERLSLVSDSFEDLACRLEGFLVGVSSPGPVVRAVVPGRRPNLVFVFSGDVSQLAGAGRELLDHEPIFCATLEKCDAFVRELEGWSLLEALRSGNVSSGAASRAQPALFALQVALADLWRSMGIEPDAVLGHGIGEVAAATVAKALSLRDALRLTCALGRLSEQKNDSRLSAQRELLPQRELLDAEHSQILAEIEWLPAAVPIHSALTGETIDGSGLDASHWLRALPEPNRLASVARLIECGHEVFLELGSKTALASAIEESLRDACPQGVALATLCTGQGERQALLHALGTLYCLGFTPNWQALYPDQGRVVPLPAYPWQRSRHWIDLHPSRAGEPTETRSSPDPAMWFYSVEWRERNSTQRIAESSTAALEVTAVSNLDYQSGDKSPHSKRPVLFGAPSRWLILAEDPANAGEALARRLESQGHACIRVTPAPAFEQLGEGHWTLDPEQQEHFSKLLNAVLENESYTGVAYFWGIGAPAAEPLTAAELEFTMKRACGGLLHLVQALAACRARIRPQLWVITRGAQAAGQGPHCTAVAQSPLWGLGKVVAIEHPEIWGGLVDLDPNASEGETDQLLEQFARHENEDLVALRGGRAFVARLCRRPPASGESARLHDDATYLITGGMGGLGLLVARWMVERGARHVVLAGRREPVQETRAFLATLEQTGARVETIAADVSREEDVLRILERIDASLPPLRGIVHAAGLLDDGVLANQTWERFAGVLAPKVAGAWNLHRLTRERSLDFFIFFSSAATVLGSPGQGNYAAANAFLEALAHDRRGQGLAATCVHWGPWDGIGMAFQRDAHRWKSRGIGLIGEAEGLKALELAISGDFTSVAILPVSWETFARRLPAGGTPPLLRELVNEPSPDPASVAERPANGELAAAVEAAAPTDRASLIRARVGRDLAHVLGMGPEQPIPSQQGFFDLGLDSLTAVELRNRLQDGLGTAHPLPSTVVFDYPTVDSLADFLMSQVVSSALRQPGVVRARVASQSSDPIAIIGIGCRFPGGAQNPEAFWKLLRDGVDAVAEIPGDRWDVEAFFDPDPEANGKMYTRYGSFLPQVDGFDPHFFGISPREALSMDPQQRLVLEVAWEALENAGVAPSRLMGSATGVFAGISGNDYQYLASSGDPGAIDAYFGTGNSYSALAGRLSYVLGLAGPSLSVDTACSSSLVAVHLACKSLRSGECGLALAAGVNLILSPGTNIGLSRARMLAPDGRCKTFDAAADGYVRGEGCGVVVLKRLSDALRDGDPILALIRGSAVNQDGRSSGLTVPNGPAQQAVIREALADAGLEPARVSYVEAHGTGTALGDPIEVQALAGVLGEGREPGHPLVIGSVKTNIGHLEAAAGIAGLIKVVLALGHQEIPPHLHFHKPTPHVPWERLPLMVPTRRVPWPSGANGNGPRAAGVSSFGFIGTNAHVVVEEAPQRPDLDLSQVRERPLHILALSARSDAALMEVAQNLAESLGNPSLALTDACFTANTGRSHFSHRAAVLAASTEDARGRLAALARGEGGAGIVRGNVNSAPKIAFLFTGQGSQYSGMSHALYEVSPVFREAMDRCDVLLRAHTDGESLLSILYDPAHSPHLSQTAWTQPALFAMEYSLAQLWRSWGIEPSIVMGHSVGEYAAACIAGMFTLEDGLKLVARRAHLMQGLEPAGVMAVVLAGEEQVSAAIAPLSRRVTIAALNGQDNTVISGERSAVEQVARTLEAAGVQTNFLTVSHAFHSPLMEPVLDQLERWTREIDYGPLRIGMISNVTGELLREGPSGLPGYWRRHAREPVRFARGVEELLRHNCDVFIEIGPAPVLLAMARKCAPPESGAWLPSLRPGKDDLLQMLESLGQLYVRGSEIDWEGFDRGYPRRKVSLPTYPFQRQRYWPDTTRLRRPSGAGISASHPFLGSRMRTALGQTVYETEFSASEPAFLEDHRIYGTVLVPGASHIAMALAAAADNFTGQSFLLEDVTFPEALALEEGRRRAVQLILSPEAAGTTFRIASAASGGLDGKNWALHAIGRVQVAESSAVAQDLSADLLLARCTDEMDGADFYSAIADRSIELGSSFRRVEQLRRRDGEAICRMRWSEEDGAVSAPLHPGLVDACFQLMSATLPRGGVDSTAFAPFAVDRFKFYSRPMAGGPLWCHAVLRSRDELARDSFTGDIKLFAESGEVIAEIEGLHIRRAPREALLSLAFGDVGDWFYQVAWRSKALTVGGLKRDTVEPPAAPASWLIFADEGGVGDAFGRMLAERGDRPIMIRAGTSFEHSSEREFRINSEAMSDFTRVCRELITNEEPRCAGAIHLWSLDAPSAESIPAGSMLSHQVALRSAVYLVQALAGQDSPPPLRLVTRGAQAARPGDAATNVTQSPIWGLGKVIALEHPELHCTRIDLDPAASGVEMAAALRDEIGAGDGEDQICYRDGDRLVARLVRLPEAGVAHHSIIAGDGAYLITGGLSGIGLVVAGWLVERGARSLVLMGRSEPMPDARVRFDELEKTGARILVIRGDVSRAEDVARVLCEAAASMPPLRGIFHSAGVLDDGVLAQQTWDRFATVLEPKVEGSWNLHILSRELPLDHFVLFSSVASVLGSAGQANYASANAFLDTLAHYRRSTGLPAVTINWGAWSGIGLAARHNLGDRLRAQGMGTISPQQGLRALERILRGDSHQVAVMPLQWDAFARQSPMAGKLPIFAELARVPVERAGEAPPAALPDLKRLVKEARPADRRMVLRNNVAALAVKVLGLDPSQPPDLRQPLNELGLDSLMAVEMRNALGSATGRLFPSTLLFNYPSVGALADFLASEVFSLDSGKRDEPSSVASGSPREFEELDGLSQGELVALLEQELKGIDAKRETR